MKTLIKIGTYTFFASSLLLIGLQAIYFSKDVVRMWNTRTLSKCLEIHLAKHDSLPQKSKELSVMDFFVQNGCLSSPLKDPNTLDILGPVHTFSSFLLSSYHKIEKTANRVSELFSQEEEKNLLEKNIKALETELKKEYPKDFVIAILTQGNSYEISVK
jgi:hypothetical protein